MFKHCAIITKHPIIIYRVKYNPGYDGVNILKFKLKSSYYKEPINNVNPNPINILNIYPA